MLDDGAIPRGLWPIVATGRRLLPNGGELLRKLNGDSDGDLGRRRSGDRGRDIGDRLRDGDARLRNDGDVCTVLGDVLRLRDRLRLLRLPRLYRNVSRSLSELLSPSMYIFL